MLIYNIILQTEICNLCLIIPILADFDRLTEIE